MKYQVDLAAGKTVVLGPEPCPADQHVAVIALDRSSVPKGVSATVAIEQSYDGGATWIGPSQRIVGGDVIDADGGVDQVTSFALTCYAVCDTCGVLFDATAGWPYDDANVKADKGDYTARGLLAHATVTLKPDAPVFYQSLTAADYALKVHPNDELIFDRTFHRPSVAADAPSRLVQIVVTADDQPVVTTIDWTWR